MSEFEPIDLPKPKGNIRYVVIGIVSFIAFISLVIFVQDAYWDGRAKELTSPCFTAMEKAWEEPDPTLAEPLLQATVYSCSNGSEWMKALREYPEAMGFDTVSGDELGIICYNYPDSPTCLNP